MRSSESSKPSASLPPASPSKSKATAKANTAANRSKGQSTFQGRPADYVVFEVTFSVRTTRGRHSSGVTPNVWINPDGTLKDSGKGNKALSESLLSCKSTTFGFQICGWNPKLTQSKEEEYRPRVPTLDAEIERKYRKLYGTPDQVRTTTFTIGVIATRTGEVYAFAGTVQPAQKGSSVSMRWGYVDTRAHRPGSRSPRSSEAFDVGEPHWVRHGRVGHPRSHRLPLTGYEFGFSDGQPGRFDLRDDIATDRPVTGGPRLPAGWTLWVPRCLSALAPMI